MAYGAETLSHGAQARRRSNAGAIEGVVAGWWRAYWAHRARSATVQALRGLDDRTLNDIGVERSEIESIVYGSPPSDRLRHFEG